MANIVQKMFLSRKECQLIDMIKKAKKVTTFSTHDRQYFEMSTAFCVSYDGLDIVATFRSHYTQGDMYTLDIVPSDIPLNISRQYNQDDWNIPEGIARRTFWRMREKYARQQR